MIYPVIFCRIVGGGLVVMAVLCFADIDVVFAVVFSGKYSQHLLRLSASY